MIRYFLTVVLISLSSVLQAQSHSPADEKAMSLSVDELRSVIGRWKVTTEFLSEDGSVARDVEGTYEFAWIVPDRVVSGKSEIPELKQTAGILFYINEKKRGIEMVSVGADGYLWIMTGPFGGNRRFSQEYKTATGGTGQLRFTRFNVLPHEFESRMEYTDDGGKTWKPGNHQRFVRVAG